MARRHSFQRGDVVLCPFAFSDASGKKQRPAVVLSTDIYHDDWDELLLLGLTSRPLSRPRPTDYELQDWAMAGLARPSWVRSKLATTHHALVRKIGQLSDRDLKGVEQSLRAATGL